jgi:predicted metal-dependent HD superfamily phosphohydrolase
MTSKKALLEAQTEILNLLKEQLPSELAYHNYEHTLDVAEASERIAKAENLNEDEILLLKTAAIFHDAGYIYTREGHEQKSCMIATKHLSEHGVQTEVIDQICELILATRVPQQPNNLLGEILCDADLDYLGRDDYFPISNSMFNELKHYGLIKTESEWKEMQVRFLEGHRYFTKTANDTRQSKKEEHLQKIKESLKAFNV